jgi:hypothetical protein
MVPHAKSPTRAAFLTCLTLPEASSKTFLSFVASAVTNHGENTSNGNKSVNFQIDNKFVYIYQYM